MNPNDENLIWEAYIDKHGNFRGGKDPNKKPDQGGAKHSALDGDRPSMTSSDPNERARAAEYETRHIKPKPERDRQRKKLGEDIHSDDEREELDIDEVKYDEGDTVALTKAVGGGVGDIVELSPAGTHAIIELTKSQTETDLVAGDRVSVHVSDLMLVPKTLEDEQED